MRRNAALAQSFGVKVEFLSGDEAERRAPHFRAAGARAILFSPEDGYFHPPLVAREFAAAAGEMGVTLAPGTAVTGFPPRGRTDSRRADVGRRDREPGRRRRGGRLDETPSGRGGHPIPMIPTRHQLFITEPIGDRAAPPDRAHPRAERVHEARAGRTDAGRLRGSPASDRHAEGAGRLSGEGSAAGRRRAVGARRRGRGPFPRLRGAKLTSIGRFRPSPRTASTSWAGREPRGLLHCSACNVGGLSISASVGRVLADLIVDGSSKPDLGGCRSSASGVTTSTRPRCGRRVRA